MYEKNALIDVTEGPIPLYYSFFLAHSILRDACMYVLRLSVDFCFSFAAYHLPRAVHI